MVVTCYAKLISSSNKNKINAAIKMTGNTRNGLKKRNAAGKWYSIIFVVICLWKRSHWNFSLEAKPIANEMRVGMIIVVIKSH